MKAFCTKCGKITNFTVKQTMVKAGDNGYCPEESWQCDECLFVPFLKPKEVTK